MATPHVQAVFAAHYVQGSACTVLLAQRRTSPASETKPGKAPKNVDYVGAAVHRAFPFLPR